MGKVGVVTAVCMGENLDRLLWVGDASGAVRFYADAAAEVTPLAGGGMAPPFM